MSVSTRSWRLKAQPRWLFRKNSIEFLIGFPSYLYKCLLVCALASYDHMTITKNYLYLTQSFPYYLYLSRIVFLDVSHQVNECARNSFLFGSHLITMRQYHVDQFCPITGNFYTVSLSGQQYRLMTTTFYTVSVMSCLSHTNFYFFIFYFSFLNRELHDISQLSQSITRSVTWLGTF